jgi:L-lactate dehydrogenase complex protein LldG
MSLESRRAILGRLRASTVPTADLPDSLIGPWIQYDDPVEQLGNMVRAVGGSMECVPTRQAVLEQLRSFPEFQDATRVHSSVEPIPSTIDLHAMRRPHDLENLDFLVAEGEWAVAENGAVWVTDQDLPHRVAYFINQHLVLVVARDRVVHNMHEAYSRIRLKPGRFGCFISGPSKTADIEQSLVIGAHGCRSLQLYVVGS